MSDLVRERSAANGFAHNPLNRFSEKREDAAFIATLRARADARMLVFAGEQALLRNTSQGMDALFAMSETAELGPVREWAFLGEGPNGPLFAMMTDAIVPDPLLASAYVAMDLRSLYLRGNLPPGVLGAMGQAKSAFNWHQKHRFCSNCGAPSVASAAGWRRECPACMAQHFPRTDPVVIMMAVEGDSCLLGRQSRFPPGMFSCLAGFLEPGETIEDAVRRELSEEAGIECGRVDYLSSQPWPFPNSLMIGCIAQAASRKLVIDREELEDARWFSRAETQAILRGQHHGGVTCPPPLAIAHQIMKDWAG